MIKKIITILITTAAQYVNENGLTEGAVLGGPVLISDDNVKKDF